MKINKCLIWISFVLVGYLSVGCSDDSVVKFNASDFGLKSQSGFDNSPLLKKAIQKLKSNKYSGKKIVLRFDKGNYEFFPNSAEVTTYYISNHDQVGERRTGLNLEGFKNFTLDGNNSQFIFHGKMLPIAISKCSGIKLSNLSVDFKNPHIAQATIIKNDTVKKEITYKLAPWVKYTIYKGNLITKGLGWEYTPSWGVAFEKDTKRMVYCNGDMALGVKKVSEIEPYLLKAPWSNKRLIPGTVVVMRSGNRPSPGVFVQNSLNVELSHITIHYAEGMGLLAQMTENITLDHFNVALKGKDDPRYFTTQADATHFSGCKGIIISKNGLYENMMDDAINIHGTYLKVIKRLSNNKVIARYMHQQSYGFDWGYVGDSVQFVKSKTMDVLTKKTKITSIKPVDNITGLGVKEFEIQFADSILPEINESGYGIENLEWTPTVVFENNTIRNNRARGALFSTPKKTIVQNNIFDHTSGSAILLCGDCNGWYETGSCKDVLIRNNRFINALTSYYQFTNAVISICPEIPDLKDQKGYFHGDKIIIKDNYFETFDKPILYAKSVDGLIFENNKIKKSNEYSPFHWNKKRFLFERVINYTIKNNDIEGGYNPKEDLLVK